MSFATEINRRQLQIPDLIKIPTSCAFTGHRETGADFSAEKLEKVVFSCIDLGITDFYCGMAVGFDLLAGELVASVKKSNFSLRLIACIPCPEQEKNYSAADKERYVSLLRDCDEKVILSDHYYRGCMLRRNDYMAERADALIAYCRKDAGGAAYTVKKFLRMKKIVFSV